MHVVNFQENVEQLSGKSMETLIEVVQLAWNDMQVASQPTVEPTTNVRMNEYNGKMQILCPGWLHLLGPCHTDNGWQHYHWWQQHICGKCQVLNLELSIIKQKLKDQKNTW